MLTLSSIIPMLLLHILQIQPLTLPVSWKWSNTTSFLYCLIIVLSQIGQWKGLPMGGCGFVFSNSSLVFLGMGRFHLRHPLHSPLLDTLSAMFFWFFSNSKMLFRCWHLRHIFVSLKQESQKSPRIALLRLHSIQYFIFISKKVRFDVAGGNRICVNLRLRDIWLQGHL